jgi:hypothetical protein
MKFWQFSDSGVVSGNSERQADGSWTAKTTFTNPAGNQIAWWGSIKPGEDKYVAESKLKVKGEEVPTRPPATWKRHEGTLPRSPIASVEPWEPKTEAEKSLMLVGDYLVGGIWKAKVPELDGNLQPTGKVIEETQEYRKVAGGRFIQQLQTKDGKKADIIHVMGIDPETNDITMWTFGDGIGTIVMTKQQGEMWQAIGKFLSDGLKSRWDATITFGEDQIEMDGRLSINGKELPKADSPTIWRRHKE